MDLNESLLELLVYGGMLVLRYLGFGFINMCKDILIKRKITLNLIN